MHRMHFSFMTKVFVLIRVTRINKVFYILFLTCYLFYDIISKKTIFLTSTQKIFELNKCDCDVIDGMQTSSTCSFYCK